MIPEYFDKKTYKVFLDYLYSLQDIKYREFHSKLIMSDKLIGVRTPELKKIASVIADGDYDGGIHSGLCTDVGVRPDAQRFGSGILGAGDWLYVVQFWSVRFLSGDDDLHYQHGRVQ